ncbi:hypothetical protein SBF1_7960005 [Candidatus Desulfosporosinus infrequens]|uniref:Uncharacterized protein n=1 Tax=Candidatus Desulfosporosinus infrequens TaxID=2043169 RepID=A0A2U3LSC7_9FIRM|nr:hypothetical protein SBF1_7960005 [Candidatus Desulfosporosinus infrequens]
MWIFQGSYLVLNFFPKTWAFLTQKLGPGSTLAWNTAEGNL